MSWRSGIENPIELELSVLIGLPLEDARRASDLQWFSFGQVRAVRDRKGHVRELGEYSLHVQCEWRIVGPNGIVVGMNDRYFTAGDNPKEPSDFDWRVQGSNRMDERLSKLMLERQSNPLVVRRVWADHTGSFRLSMSDDYSLEVFPCETIGNEFWRLFQPGNTSSHFVVTGLGIQA